MPKQRYFRPGDTLDDNAVVIIRGGDLERGLLRADAERCFTIYGTYGISVFAARDASLDELAQQPPLVRFEVLTLTTVGALRLAGLRLEPTGRNPRHFTVAFDHLDDGVERLLSCEHRRWANPYHEE